MKDRKKILHVVENSDMSGSEHVVRSLARGVDHDSFASSMLVLNEKGKSGDELEKEGYPVHAIDWKPRNLTTFQVCREFRRIVVQEEIDIIHSHNLIAWYFSVLSCFFLFKKQLVTIHGFIEDKKSHKKVLALLFLSLFTNKIILVSSRINFFPFNLLKFLNKVSVIKNGIDLSLFSGSSAKQGSVRDSLSIEKNDFIILTLTRYAPVKNIEYQLRLVMRLAKIIPSVKLLIAADFSSYADNIKKLAAELGVEGRISMLGLRNDVPELLRAADVFILSSFIEGTSIALLEAMANGTISVVSDVGGNPDIIRHEENGFLFDLDDFDGAVQIFEKIYNNGYDLTKIAENARQTTRDYSTEKMVTRYMSLYNT